MQRPTVLHCAERWVQPSQGFVLDLVRSTTATRAVAACRWREPAPPDVGPMTFPVRSLEGAMRRLPWLPVWPTLPALLAAVALRERAELLHCHLGYWAEPVAAVAGRLRVPWVLSLHGDDLLAHPRRNPAVLAAYAKAELVIVPSRWLADKAAGIGLDAERIRVIPSGIDLSRLPFRARQRLPGDPITVTFAGRFVEKKGVLDAAQAIALATHRLPELRAVFVGHGPLEPELRALIARLGLAAEIRDGSVPGAVRQALMDTDLALTASTVAANGDAETLGLVNVEALALGVPLVSTRSGGVPEYVPAGVPEDTAAPSLLADEGDVQGLAAHLVTLASTPDTWARRGAAGRAHVAQVLELGARTADVEQQYLSLLRTGRPAPGPAPIRPERPTVSVIMVTHNRKPLLERALTALDAQTLPDVQIVVVDNGCTDGSSELLSAREGPGFTVLRSPDNSPPAVARNRAAAVATGAVLAFTDDDCRPTATWLEALLSGMREGVSVVQGRTVADPTQPLLPLSRTQWTPAEYGLYETANIAYEATAFRQVGGFDEDLAREVATLLGPRLGRYPFGEDTDLAWRVRRAGGRTRFAPHALVHHHVFEPDVRYLLRRSVLAAGFPLIVARVPELRSVFLTRRFVLGPQRLPFLSAVAGLTLSVLDVRAGLLMAPYAWRLLQPRRPGRRARLAAVPVIVARDALETAALTAGSVRSRSLVI